MLKLIKMDEIEFYEQNIEERLKALEDVRKLPAKQRKFAEEFAVTNSPYKAALKAGYSPKACYSVSYNLLRNEKVKKAIAVYKAELRIRHNIDRDYFIVHLKDIIESKFTKITDKISALTLLARITGHIKEKPPEAKQLVILKQSGLTDKTIEIEEIQEE